MLRSFVGSVTVRREGRTWSGLEVLEDVLVAETGEENSSAGRAEERRRSPSPKRQGQFMCGFDAGDIKHFVRALNSEARYFADLFAQRSQDGVQPDASCRCCQNVGRDTDETVSDRPLSGSRQASEVAQPLKLGQDAMGGGDRHPKALGEARDGCCPQLRHGTTISNDAARRSMIILPG